MKPTDASLDLEALESEFILAWQKSNNPRIEDYIAGLGKAERNRALEVLIPIDVQNRFQTGQDIDARCYLDLGERAIEIASEIFAEETPETPARELATVVAAGDIEDNMIAESLTKMPDDSGTEENVLISDRYKLISKIGQGGMGTVWLAEQETPIRRRVAIKIIGQAMNSKEALARFSAERQALAMMNHPNIARVLDAGSTEDGRPFFAMEWVKGIPITNYCNNSCLTIESRLQLLIEVCDAVQHAHQKGIIHRDLKPSNILVTLQEGKPVPKVIDFGLAKALDHAARLTDDTLVTEIGKVVGTLQYMSPEQASSSELDVDTRTDIYSLGVILYQLLTDIVPLEKNSLTGKSLLQIVILIQELQIVRPSAKLTGDEEKLSIACAQRRTDSRQLTRKLEGELDWIVMKTLQRDRTERYQAASALADDMRRFLNDEPIEALPPSKTYLLKKFVRKNKGLVATIGSFVGLIAIALVVVIGFWNRAEDQRKIAERATNEAKTAKENVVKEKNKIEELLQIAEEATKRAKETKKLILKPLKEANVLVGGNKGLLANDMLVQILEDLNKPKPPPLEPYDPMFVADFQFDIGRTLRGNSQYSESINALTESYSARSKELGKDHVKSLSANQELLITTIHILKERIASQINLDEATKIEITREFDQALRELKQTTEKISSIEKPDANVEARILGTSYLLAFKELKKMGVERKEYVQHAIRILERNYEMEKAKGSTESGNTYLNLANGYLKEESEANIEKAISMNSELDARWGAEAESETNELTINFLLIKQAKARNNLAESYHAKANLKNDPRLYAIAIEKFEEALIAKTELMPLNHSSRFNTIRNMVRCLCDASKIQHAKELFDTVTIEFQKSQLARREIKNALDQLEKLRQTIAEKFKLDENWSPR